MVVKRQENVSDNHFYFAHSPFCLVAPCAQRTCAQGRRLNG